MRWAISVLSLASAAHGGGVEAWYTLSLSGTPAGWSHTSEEVEGTRRVSRSTEQMTIGRAGVEVTVRAETVWTDDLDGRPQSMRWSQLMAGTPVETVWTFAGDKIEVSVTQGDRTSTSTQPAPEVPWLTPAAGRTYLAARAEAGAEEVSWRGMLPDLGLQPVLQTLTLVGRETLDVRGRTMDVTKWDVRIEGMPVQMQTWYASDWRPVQTIMQAPFGALRSTLATKAEALRSASGTAPELFLSLFVTPVGAGRPTSDASRAVLKVRSLDGSALDLPSAGSQTILARDGATTTLLVDRTAGQAPQAEVSPACLASSAMIDGDDPRVRALVEKAVEGLPAEAGEAARAEAARVFVHRWITKKGLATAFASASETAASRTGDCSEHGVLLAAMLRSMGIPARTASGLVWMEGADAFGWHMWTQALIDGKWVDLDATLPVPFTVGHILVATSNLEDGDGQRELMSLLGLLGNLEIEIVRVEP